MGWALPPSSVATEMCYYPHTRAYLIFMAIFKNQVWLGGEAFAPSPAPGSSPSKSHLWTQIFFLQGGGSQGYLVPFLCARCWLRGTWCSSCAIPGTTTLLWGLSSPCYKQLCYINMVYDVKFFLFHEKTFLNGLSEVTVKVWARVEFCSFTVAGMRLGFIFGLIINKCLCSITCLSGLLVLALC